LVSVKDLELVFTKYIQTETDDCLWVGGRLDGRANSSNFKEHFVWLTGDFVSPFNSHWKHDEPDVFNHQCICIADDKGTWRKDGRKGPFYDTVGCDSKYRIVCETY